MALASRGLAYCTGWQKALLSRHASTTKAAHLPAVNPWRLPPCNGGDWLGARRTPASRPVAPAGAAQSASSTAPDSSSSSSNRSSRTRPSRRTSRRNHVEPGPTAPEQPATLPVPPRPRPQPPPPPLLQQPPAAVPIGSQHAGSVVPPPPPLQPPPPPTVPAGVQQPSHSHGPAAATTTAGGSGGAGSSGGSSSAAGTSTMQGPQSIMSHPLPRVLILHTGGTLGMDVEQSFEVDPHVEPHHPPVLKKGTGGEYGGGWVAGCAAGGGRYIVNRAMHVLQHRM